MQNGKHMDANKNKSTISGADSLEKIGEFWDNHDFTQYDAGGEDIEFTVTCAVPLELDLYSKVEKEARLRGVTVETLVNLWPQQKLNEQRGALSHSVRDT
jgi:hypothetical protein